MIFSIFRQQQPRLPSHRPYKVTQWTTVSIRQGCSLQSLEAAEAIAGILSRALQKQVAVQTGVDFKGIVVGSFEELGLPDLATPEPETFLVRSHSRGVVIAASRPFDVTNAAWHFLHVLGYRQFFPGPLWEELPVLPTVVKVDGTVRSPFRSRRLFIGNGQWPENKAAFEDWLTKNLVPSGFRLNTGHSFQNVIRRNRALFVANPQLYGLVNGKRESEKLCLSNETVQQLLDYEALRSPPTADTVSIEPNDGGGWCECDSCVAMGPPSDRMVTISNRVAHALVSAGRPTVPAFYAYNEHAPPPSLYLSNPAIVSTTRKYTRGLNPLDTLIGWGQRGAALGMRDYWSVFSWDYDLPGQAEVMESDPQGYAAVGAAHYTTELGDNWVAYGHLYYALTKQLWGVNAGTDDLRQRLFGPAAEAMRPYFEAVASPQLSRETVRAMYAAIAQAQALPLSERMRQRLNHYAAYTRYVELFRVYQRAPTSQMEAALQDLSLHVKALSGKGIVHARAFAQDYVRLGPATSTQDQRLVEYAPTGAALPDFSADVLRGSQAPAIHFTKRSFEGQLLFVDFGGARTTQLYTDYGTGRRVFWLHLTEPTSISISGGLKQQGARPVEITVTMNDFVEIFEVPADRLWREVSIPGRGIVEVEVNDTGGGTSIQFPPGLVWAVYDPAAPHFGRRTGYFYVPRGTSFVGGYSRASVGAIYDADGVFQLSLPRGSDVFEVPVLPGQDGRVWSFRDCVGTIDLQSVPPWSGPTPGALLLPADAIG